MLFDLQAEPASLIGKRPSMPLMSARAVIHVPAAAFSCQILSHSVERSCLSVERSRLSLAALQNLQCASQAWFAI